ncbi:hypothetical protein CHL67_01300 [Prosthecochloris sp. GSB1]|uniref:hypothetical protein n=1 Tax=Prosthecochloris sp. GSB1 TaxID=281093 RepID=UPI000B8D1015|nr:hypothetical protein [Prosthecochloris sp. GSB1]ASQ89737.1 hypothetical protein CHL67_01300 [Prosthecochloris sp. GSB1]
MYRNLTGKVLRHGREARQWLACALRRNPGESVFFYTFHKCASTLFSAHVLKSVRGLRNVDYARRIYAGGHTGTAEFVDKGYVYGPIRLSAIPGSPVYENLVGPASEKDFIENRIAVFLIRDPRDILVSSYYSFGFTHGESGVGEIGLHQRMRRERIAGRTVDDYVLDAAPVVRANFLKLGELNEACRRSVVLRYEDMIFDWELFTRELTKYLDIGPSVLRRIYAKSRPRSKEDRSSHRRSGMPGGFRDTLRGRTVDQLNEILGEALDAHGYRT